MQNLRDLERPFRRERLLENRVALVTGSSRGIGAATARLLAEHGASVGVNYVRDAESARNVVESIEDAGGEAIAVQADARDEGQTREMVREVEGRFGAVDTLVLNATTADLVPGPLVDQDTEAIVRITESQLRLAIAPLKAVVPSMISRGAGCIVAVGSQAARVPVEGMSPVSVAKSALEALMRSAALELGPHGIRVNVATPGLVLTELNDWMPEEVKEQDAAVTPLRRNAVPEDVARAVLMLVSGNADFVTGAVLPINGGRYMS